MAEPTGIITSKLQEIQTYLQNSEWTLIQFMIEKGVWKGSTANLNPPEGYTPEKSNVDFGLAPYWLNHPEALNFPPTLEFELGLTILLWQHFAGAEFPTTQMTAENYNHFYEDKASLIYTDGSVLSGEPYATYDPKWFLALCNLIITLVSPGKNGDGLWYHGFTFPPIDTNPVPLSGTNPNKVSIAIVGDWGANSDPARNVMAHLKQHNPDYIIHLGDVYYSGTPQGTDAIEWFELFHHQFKYFDLGEEQTNLLGQWPSGYSGRSFTLNSNHEMYTGANGLFLDALGHNGQSDIFSAQQGQSCFHLQFGDWNILGLDSAYMGTSTDLFLSGNIGENGVQSQWIQGLNLDPRKTIVLTHHNGLEPDCSKATNLWTQIRTALGGDPYAWYWGHVHNGIAYRFPITIPPLANPAEFEAHTFARCIGHGSVPYGDTDSLNVQGIEWREGNVNPETNQLFNGYAIIELSLDSENAVNNITEQYFDTSQLGPVKSIQILPAPL